MMTHRVIGGDGLKGQWFKERKRGTIEEELRIAVLWRKRAEVRGVQVFLVKLLSNVLT